MSNSNNISLNNSNSTTILFDNKFENIIMYFGLINIIIVLIIIIYIVIYCIIRYKNQGNPTLNIHSFAMKKILSRHNNLGPGQNYEFKSVNNASSIGESINQPNNMSLNEIKEKNFKDSINNIINSTNLNNSGETGESRKKKKGKKKKQINNNDDVINVNSKEENNSIEMELDNNNNDI